MVHRWGMGNVLSDDKKQQVVALGRLGWSLRRIEEATAVRSRDGQRLSASRRGGGPGPGWSAEGVAAKTGHHAGGVHRPRIIKTGHRRDGVHRPWATLFPWARAECQCLQAVP